MINSLYNSKENCKTSLSVWGATPVFCQQGFVNKIKSHQHIISRLFWNPVVGWIWPASWWSQPNIIYSTEKNLLFVCCIKSFNVKQWHLKSRQCHFTGCLKLRWCSGVCENVTDSCRGKRENKWLNLWRKQRQLWVWQVKRHRDRERAHAYVPISHEATHIHRHTAPEHRIEELSLEKGILFS